MKYITTPIYYANDLPHIGHAVTTLAADVIARYWRLTGQETFFLTGTDEHGAKIAEAAQAANQEPKAFVDGLSPVFQSAWQELGIEPDGFIRTTDPKHEAFVGAFLQNLYDHGFIYEGEYHGLYCVGCEEFKTESQIGPNNTCLIHLKALIEFAEEAYLFKLQAFQERLVNLIESDEFEITPAARKNEILSFIKLEGLKDVAISRKNVAWGIPLPWDGSHTIYVWIDALLNYLSAADHEGPEFADHRRPKFPPALQLIGKDILRFHSIIWPALLLAAKQPLPKKLLVHGFFTINGQKMSKSLGNILTPHELIERYGAAGARYLLLAAIPYTSDGDVSLKRLDALYTSDLANNFGNLVNRAQAMLLKYRDGRAPEVVGNLDTIRPFIPINDYHTRFAELESLSSIIELLQKSISQLNGYIQKTEPWALAKENKASELDMVLAALAESVYVLGALFAPFMPEISQKILASYGSSIEKLKYDTLLIHDHTGGRVIRPIEPLFPRLESLNKL